MKNIYEEILVSVYKHEDIDTLLKFYSMLSENREIKIGAIDEIKLKYDIIAILTIPLSSNFIKVKDIVRIISYKDEIYKELLYKLWVALAPKGGTVIVDEFFDCFYKNNNAYTYMGNIAHICDLLV